MRFALMAFAALLACVGPLRAEENVTLGWGRLFSNDALGDGHDRWRTGSYAVSWVRGVRWTGSLPKAAGEILEFRLRGDTIAPESLTDPVDTDRRYAGAITLGVHSQFDLAGFEAGFGGDLVFVGPQTGVGSFQSKVHDALGLGEILVLDDQIGDTVRPTVSGEIAKRLSFGDTMELRPFVAMRAGDETLLRAGADLVIGGIGRDDLMLRDVATGQRFRGVSGSAATGVSVVMGGDIAQMFDSIYLPDDGAATLSETRHRLRAGVRWQGERSQAFYGVTYLSPEFDTQDEGQVIGSLSLNFRF